jgi:NAD(P)-dependent dehydrogenase (short-subunit alcohol dehydrogenase family)
MNTNELARLYDFTGKTFVVTGGAGVLGGVVAQALYGCGANVCLLGRKLAAAEAAAARLGPRALGVPADVTRRDELSAALAAVNARFGPVHGLVNAAGGNMPAATTSAERGFFDLPEEALRQVFDLNLMGTVLPCQVFGQQMAQQHDGVILNYSSLAALKPLTRTIGYSAAKAGVSNFTQWLAVHMAKTYSPNIRVNGLAPGFFVGEQNRALLIDAATGELTPRGRSIIEHTPAGRFGTPEDLAGAALWLLSPAAAFVTGIVVAVDGGFSAFAGV